jgi:dinuclear metal center YbgI/SA1388 family protein
LVTHHGILTKNNASGISGVTGKRIRALLRNEISLYVAHLPLDFHKEVGNHIALAEKLGFENFELVEIKDARGINIGNFVLSTLDNEMSCGELGRLLSERLDTKITYQEPKEKRKIKRVGILTGSAMSLLEDVLRTAEIDAFICGEGKHTYTYHAEELGVNVFYAGHYTTEKFGLMKLKTQIKNNFKNLKTVFIDNPPEIREV